MNIKKIFGLAIFCIGIFVLLFAFSATQSSIGVIFKWLTGYYNEHTIVALIAGILMFIFGGILIFRSKK